MPLRTSSVVESVASAANSIRTQRAEGLALVETRGAELSEWLHEMIKIYQAQIIEMEASEEALPQQTAAGDDDNSLPEDLIDWIESLKKKELQYELQGRNLNPKGLKDELRERLIQSMVEERQKAKQQQQAKNKKEAPLVAAEAPAPVEEVAQCMNSMEISMEKPVGLTKASEHDNMQDVILIDDDDDVVVHMETEAKPAIPEPKEVLKSNTDTDVTASQKTRDIVNTEKKTCTAAENNQDGAANSSPKSKTIRQDTETSQPKATNAKAPVTLPTQPTSQSPQKSPLRRMQSTVQSALRNLRPVSPKKQQSDEQQQQQQHPRKKSPPKPKKQVVVLPQTYSTDETEASNSSRSEDAPCPTTTTVPAAPVVPVPGATRTVATPAVVPPASSGTSKLGGLGSINSDSVKAKNNARMARIDEMRNKSKQVTSATSSTKANNIPALGGLKVSSSALKATNNNSSKRQNLASQMREKAFGRSGQAATTSSAAPSVLSKEPVTQQMSSNSSTPSGALADPKKEGTPPPSAKSVVRSPVLSPLDTYELSDHGGSSDTDEEEERARRVGKRVPNWAHKENLKQALHRQYTDNSVDPDDMFGEVTTCNLEAIFGRKKTKYQKRTSSGNWTRDRATVAEKLAFKRQMGFAVEA